MNYVGRSAAMEAEGTVLWQRSVETHNLKYKWIVSDGDIVRLSIQWRISMVIPCGNT